ncbi:ChaN family lipoprotein [Rubrivirga marina]|uniref:Haem-binding uptake Tiki superfamily ChaN domain-containing protein n=1 Tax=Rubrivirga marina TaxID=1196024 RepID=A0A271IWE1_9BACT|nr:ChaN family lipoprotein [Rubrivirga marina]PAP75248.1 hypothetical protein BSZ37_01720 [Rubrivirga marina]
MLELCTAALLFAASAGAPTPGPYVVLDGAGQRVELGVLCDALADADVVFLGELHDDSTAHALELELLAAAHVAAQAADRPLVLALEMVETDVQPVLDEYLAGLIRERDWLAASRPWGNYDTDYRPLVEFAKAEGVPVVASNAPGRYVSLVSRRGGLAVLDSVATAQAWLPLEVAPPSEALAAKFTDLMGGMSHGAGPTVEGMLAAQNLRDATMAWRIAETLDARPGALVVHVNGSFHSDDRLGIPEHLARLAPEARTLVVTMRRETGPEDAEVGANDFVILTSAGE